ncbi:response regulator transcription factor [Streptomyces sp. CACIS-1.16CA]|uniref:Helix-turn-helix transcriptional regulator n=2 Tax=Streptomyces TaxID=1883 RepID=A0AAU8KRP3_9ACTN|nr:MULTISPECIES: helix-turn-helix transcriptional regulator [unclassified Streptomyces]NUV70543.1 helix-turn-helix transcriptional regulator [Streptomyces sp. CAI-121]NUV99667.1 helix-turn-helix transcriptional regulator [Streptomyces sp. CAI 127]NUW16701.1 helix-turn-helix transcriptional regulator [Streptomyces sp. CAI-68]PVC94338.1 helix-turn-helix transcriptional regulator [Streptomyces sp. CS147]SBV05482.1 Response regulator containing a CheY-like receiver domain and an HTH DNA-binding do
MPEAVDAVEMQAALSRLRRTSGLPVVFGGLLSDARHARIAELNGAQTSALRGLVISAGSGLGGKAIALSRPCAVTDYPASRHISHEYDAAVAAEGLRSVVAAPVVVRRAVRGVLYGALRTPVTLGDRTFDAVVAAARDVEQSLAVRDSARQLLAAGRERVSDPDAVPGAWEDVREAHRDLRALVPRVVDPALRDELLEVCGRLASASGARASTAREVRLAPREVDVVACVAAGATNAAAAERLGLRPETVKGYLRSAMRKLGAHTRLEAVVAARRAGLLP